MPATRENSSVETAVLTKRNCQTDIALAIAEVRPKHVVFHPRTVTYSVFRESAQSFPDVEPIFLLDSLHAVSVEADPPPSAWLEFLKENRAGNCRLYYTNVPLGDPLPQYPPDVYTPVRVPNRDPDRNALLIYGDVRPSRDPLRFVAHLVSLQIEAKEVYLSLGDASGVCASYKSVVVETLKLYYPDLVVMPLLSHEGLLNFIAQNVATLVSLNQPWRASSTTVLEASEMNPKLRIHTWKTSGMRDFDTTSSSMAKLSRIAHRSQFWDVVCQKSQ